jgi:hypothetical protein
MDRRTLLAGAAAAAAAVPVVALAAPRTDPHAAWLAEARRLWRIDSGTGEDVAGDRAAALEDRVIDTPDATFSGLLAQASLLLDYVSPDVVDDSPTARSARALASGLERLAGEARHV